MDKRLRAYSRGWHFEAVDAPDEGATRHGLPYSAGFATSNAATAVFAGAAAFKVSALRDRS